MPFPPNSNPLGGIILSFSKSYAYPRSTRFILLLEIKNMLDPHHVCDVFDALLAKVGDGDDLSYGTK